MLGQVDVAVAVILIGYDQDELIVGALDLSLSEALFLFGRLVGERDVVERHQPLEVCGRDRDRYAQHDDDDGHPLVGDRLADKVEPRGDDPIVVSLVYQFLGQYEQDGLNEYDRKQRQYDALCKDKAEIVADAVVHEEQRDKAADRRQRARQDGFERLGHRVHECDLGVFERAQLLLEGVAEEDGVVHRDRQLQDDRARRGDRRDRAYRVARDDVGAHVEQDGYAQRREEDERFEIAVRRQQQNDEHDQHRRDDELGHVVERAVDEDTRVLRHTGEVVPLRRVVDLSDRAVLDALVQNALYLFFERVQSIDDGVVRAALREVDVEYVCGLAVRLFDKLVLELGAHRIEIGLNDVQYASSFKQQLKGSVLLKVVKRTYPNDIARKERLVLDRPFECARLFGYVFRVPAHVCVVGSGAVDKCDDALDIFTGKIGYADSGVADDAVLFVEHLLADRRVRLGVEIGQHVAFLVGQYRPYDGQRHQQDQNAYDRDLVIEQPFGKACHFFSFCGVPRTLYE